MLIIEINVNPKDFLLFVGMKRVDNGVPLILDNCCIIAETETLVSAPEEF